MVVVGVAERARQDAHFGQPLQLGAHARDPVERRLPVDARVLLRQQPAAEREVHLRQHHARAAACRRQGRREPGRAAAHHQHVAVREGLVVAVGIALGRRLAEARGAADELLPEQPALRRGRPHEGLVVEARGQDLRDPARHRAQVEGERGPAVLRLRDQAVVELALRRLDVRLGARLRADLHQRVRLLDAGADDAARPVVLEAAADEVHAVRQQRRGQRVAGIALVALAVEGEGERPAAVDLAAGGQAMALGLGLRHRSCARRRAGWRRLHRHRGSGS